MILLLFALCFTYSVCRMSYDHIKKKIAKRAKMKELIDEVYSIIRS